MAKKMPGAAELVEKLARESERLKIQLEALERENEALRAKLSQIESQSAEKKG